MSQPRVHIVDLNNFARYPTLAVGYLASVCRRADMSVDVYSPLSVGVQGITREQPSTIRQHWSEKLNYLATNSRSKFIRSTRTWAATRFQSQLSRQQPAVLSGFRRSFIAHAPDVVLISTYLAYHGLVKEICTLCADAGVPTIVGGPYFTQADIIDQWITIEGLTVLAAGEIELDLPDVIRAVIAGNDPSTTPGVLTPNAHGTYNGTIAPPLQSLDDVPYPDYTDFPWDKYPERIVPIVTGRGCGWGACTFCSDITSSAGRTYRSRSPDNVLGQIRKQYEELGVTLFVFSDLKLNSNLFVWRAIIENMQHIAPSARWAASIHVGREDDNGLSATDLCAAADSGCVRLTTGLESGSQRMLDLMSKGTCVDRVSDFLRSATAATISTRCTMIAGYPGELADDVRASANFVHQHRDDIERINLCTFKIISGTTVHRMVQRESKKLPDVTDVSPVHHLSVLDHRYVRASDRPYRRAMMELYNEVHEVNRQALREHARVFEGVM